MRQYLAIPTSYAWIVTPEITCSTVRAFMSVQVLRWREWNFRTSWKHYSTPHWRFACWITGLQYVLAFLPAATPKCRCMFAADFYKQRRSQGHQTVSTMALSFK